VILGARHARPSVHPKCYQCALVALALSLREPSRLSLAGTTFVSRPGTMREEFGPSLERVPRLVGCVSDNAAPRGRNWAVSRPHPSHVCHATPIQPTLPRRDLTNRRPPQSRTPRRHLPNAFLCPPRRSQPRGRLARAVGEPPPRMHAPQRTAVEHFDDRLRPFSDPASSAAVSTIESPYVMRARGLVQLVLCAALDAGPMRPRRQR
jgi:hypothetical protein